MEIYNSEIANYIRETFAQEDQTLKTIRAQIPAKGLPEISVKPEEGLFLQFITAASGGQRVLEVGTLGGYSGTWIARGLSAGGKLLTVEKDSHHATVAREHFLLAGVADQVEVLEGDANDILPALDPVPPFDFVFLDARKSDYPAQFRWALQLLRPGGIVGIHNAFQNGTLTDESIQDPAVNAVRETLQNIAQHSELSATVFPAGDGMALAV